MSRRVFELANKIHELLSSHGVFKYLFGGKQVILVGDFVQLRLVGNSFDLGIFRFRFSSFHQVDSSSIRIKNAAASK